MATGMLEKPIVSTVSRGPNALAKCPDDLPRRPTVPFAARFHLMAPSFSNWLPQKKEEFESPQVEVETPSSVLPHRGRGPIVVANQDDRIHWLEPALQDTEDPETDRRVTASAVLIRDDPTENPSGTEDPMRFQRDLFHLIVETCIAARDSTKTAGVRTVGHVVRIRGVDHRDRGGAAPPTPPHERRIARAKRSGPWENGTPPGSMNGGRRGRYAKVKICLGRGESSKEAADLREGRVRPSSIPKMEGGGGIREAQRFADGWPRQFRVRIRCVEDVPATRRVVDRHIERGTPDEAGGRDDDGPPLPLMDDVFGGPQRAKPLSRSNRRLVSGHCANLGLIPEEHIDVRDANAHGLNAVGRPPLRIRRNVQRGRRPEPSGAREERRSRLPDEAARPPEPGSMDVMDASHGTKRNVREPEPRVRARIRDERTPSGGPGQGHRAPRWSARIDE